LSKTSPHWISLKSAYPFPLYFDSPEDTFFGVSLLSPSGRDFQVRYATFDFSPELFSHDCSFLRNVGNPLWGDSSRSFSVSYLPCPVSFSPAGPRSRLRLLRLRADVSSGRLTPTPPSAPKTPNGQDYAGNFFSLPFFLRLSVCPVVQCAVLPHTPTSPFTSHNMETGPFKGFHSAVFSFFFDLYYSLLPVRDQFSLRHPPPVLKKLSFLTVDMNLPPVNEWGSISDFSFSFSCES